MSETNPNIDIVNVDEELGRSYVNYAMSVIIARALPDVRDGMKPVQRRILYDLAGFLQTLATFNHLTSKKSCSYTSLIIS